MSNISPVTGDQLASALHILGVSFLLGGTNADNAIHKQPTYLIAALAESNEARLRLSLIPLFLEHPEFSAYALSEAKKLRPSARLTLQCYYSAAVFLQRKYRARLGGLLHEKILLPDIFSEFLGLQATNDPEKNLSSLAKRHQELSGVQVNWLGTYEHAAQIWIKGLELQSAV